VAIFVKYRYPINVLFLTQDFKQNFVSLDNLLGLAAEVELDMLLIQFLLHWQLCLQLNQVIHVFVKHRCLRPRAKNGARLVLQLVVNFRTSNAEFTQLVPS
jgi:hypothetical protein